MEEHEHHYEKPENEIDLMEIVSLVLRKWYVILASVVIVMSLVGIYAYTVMEDVYTAETRMLVQVEDETSSDVVNYQLGERLVNTYTEIARSSNVLSKLQDRMADDLGVEYSKNTIRDMLDVEGVEQTVVIIMSIESTSRSEATYMANTLVEIIQETSAEFQGLDNIEVLDEAQLPEGPSGPNRMLYMAVAFVLGGMIGTFTVLGMEYLNRTVKSSRDMETKLNLRVLGEIPEYGLEEEVEE
ncbi:MAG: YveK family protein [Candidatus Izemoplasmataceae bacterium]